MSFKNRKMANKANKYLKLIAKQNVSAAHYQTSTEMHVKLTVSATANKMKRT